MSKILKPIWLTPAAILVILSGILLTSCNQSGEKTSETAINSDTVKNHIISIGEAVELTRSFRAAIDTLDKKVPHFKDSMDFGHAEAFPADVFRELLKQRDSLGAAVGIRIYYGRDADGKIRQILVPVDSAGNDIVNHMLDTDIKPNKAHVEALKVSNGQALQNGQRCPTLCGDDSSGLN